MDGGAQLVGHVLTEGLQARKADLDLVEQAVDGAGVAIDVILGAPGRKPRRQRTRIERVRDLRRAPQRREREPGRRKRHERDQPDADRQRPPESVQHLVALAHEAVARDEDLEALARGERALHSHSIVRAEPDRFEQPIRAPDVRDRTARIATAELDPATRVENAEPASVPRELRTEQRDLGGPTARIRLRPQLLELREPLVELEGLELEKFVRREQVEREEQDRDERGE